MTTFGIAKAALVDLWVPALAPLRIIYGPRTKPITKDWLRVGGVFGEREVIPLAVHGQMAELYTIACSITTTEVGDGDEKLQQVVTERAIAWFQQAELVLRSLPDENLGLAQVHRAYISGEFELSETDIESAPPAGARLTFGVQVQAEYRIPLA